MEAKLYGADMLFIAGDLFEEDYVTKDTMLFAAGELERFGKPVFITPGNHDPYHHGSPYTLVEMPQNVKVFTQSEISFEDVELHSGKVRIYGHAYNCENPSYYPLDGFDVKSFDGAGEVAAHILISHSVVDEVLSPYACLTREQICSSGLDYVALGHIHKHGGVGRVGKTVVCYSGCLEGRDFGECGVKGAVFGEITLQEGRMSVNCLFRRLCHRHFETAELDISLMRDISSLGEAVTNVCKDFDDDVNLRITLTGTKHSSIALHTDVEQLKQYSQKAKLCEIVDKTTPFVDVSELEKDRGIRGEFYRRLKPMLLGEDPAKRELATLALSYGLDAFDAARKRK